MAVAIGAMALGIGRRGRVWAALAGALQTFVAMGPMFAIAGAPQQVHAQLGACCLESGECQEIGEIACCALLGGVWQGDNSTCATANCAGVPVGACCNSGRDHGEQECFGVTTICNCDPGDGSAYYLGDGTVCTQCPQLPGACCTPGDNCVSVSPADCLSLGGVWQGVGTWCIGPPCPHCYPNCDGSSDSPVLNVADFTCFFQKFATGDSYANCDDSTTPPILNVGDFTCFLQKFAQGCP